MSPESEPIIEWLIENIPNEDFLFKRVHKNYIVDGKIIPGVFKETGEGLEKGMSTDWDKYITPEDSLSNAINPFDNGLICLNVGQIRDIPKQIVEHSPDIPRKNRAHTDVKGIDDPEKKERTKIRANYLKIFEWKIKHSSVIE